MFADDIATALGPALVEALTKRGFDSLTPVQEGVLAKNADAHDLRISSQTGSGKTVAIGLALRNVVAEKTTSTANVARPRAIVITPTRELAKQVQEELSWLFAPLGARVAVVTGGGGYRDELRAFASGPAVIVGTPGRLVDHLQRKGIDPANVAAAVLDEADRMLDLGFREDIETILGKFPAHRTHLVSATFPREVRALADRVQVEPLMVEGTPIGRANADIEHVIHLVHMTDRLDAIVNLLLEDPGAQTLIFARTRADVAAMTGRLREAGFAIDSLSGEMEQRERHRALAAFKRGDLDALVATDVAARGIDVSDIARVIHAEPPDDPDSYTHRSGRTGRAGRKGQSALLVSPGALRRTQMLLRRANVSYKNAPVPSADKIRASEDAKLLRELGAEDGVTFTEPDERARALAAEIVKGDRAEQAVARLVMKMREKRPEPRDVQALEPRPESPRDYPPSRVMDRNRVREPVRTHESPRDRGEQTHEPARDRRQAPPRERKEERTHATTIEAPRESKRDVKIDPKKKGKHEARYVPFRVSWGSVHGADTRRLLAMVCRRGEIESGAVGTIRVAASYSIVEVREDAARAFAAKTSVPDPRDPRVTIRAWEGATPRSEAPVKERPSRKSVGGHARPKRGKARN